MAHRSLFIATYDVSSPARLRQVRRAVKAYASGGQKSVFECFLTPMERKTLIAKARELINEREDRFALLRVEQRAAPVLLGIAEPPLDPDLHLVY